MTSTLRLWARTVKHRTFAAMAVLFAGDFSYSKRKFLYHKLSFSQEGEDSLLLRILEYQQLGFYVDVGAHHPQRFSNTYLFYLCGWAGINIDPLPGSKAQFDSLRPRDINIELGVSSEAGSMTYYAFDEPAFNTFNSEVAKTRTSKLLSKHIIAVQPLRDILANHLPTETPIDFLSIDVEGLDLDVLRSNDWNKFRPRYVLAESLCMPDIRHVQQTDLHAFMESVGYCFFAKTLNTLFFADAIPRPLH